MDEQSSCCLCRAPVALGAGYVVRIDVFADPQIPAMTAEQIESADFGASLAEVMEQMKQMTPDEVQDGVHRRFEYRLCPACQRKYLANPLGMPRQAPVGKN
jgi:hypothetical protein